MGNRRRGGSAGVESPDEKVERVMRRLKREATLVDGRFLISAASSTLPKYNAALPIPARQKGHAFHGMQQRHKKSLAAK